MNLSCSWIILKAVTCCAGNPLPEDDMLSGGRLFAQGIQGYGLPAAQYLEPQL